MSLPAVLYKDRLEIGFTHSNQSNGSKARQLVDLNGSHRASQYTMGGTVNSKVNDAGLMALIGNVKTLILEASAIENETDILANDNDVRLDIQLLEAFGADIVNVQDFAQSIIAAESTIDGPLPVEQLETLSKLIVDMAELRQMVLHADTLELKVAMQVRASILIEEVLDALEVGGDDQSIQMNAILSPAVILATMQLMTVTAQHFGVGAQFSQRFEAVQKTAVLRQSIEVAAQQQQQSMSMVMETLQQVLQNPELDEQRRVTIESTIEALMSVQEGQKSLSPTLLEKVQKLVAIEGMAPVINTFIQATMTLNEVSTTAISQGVQISNISPIVSAIVKQSVSNEISARPMPEAVRYAQKASPISADNVIRSAPINFSKIVPMTSAPINISPLVMQLKEALPALPERPTASDKALFVYVEKLAQTPPPSPKEIDQIIVEIEARLPDDLPQEERDAITKLVEEIKGQPNLDPDKPDEQKLKEPLPEKLDDFEAAPEPIKPDCGPICNCFPKPKAMSSDQIAELNAAVNKNSDANRRTSFNEDGSVTITIRQGDGSVVTQSYTAEEIARDAEAVATEVKNIENKGWSKKTTTAKELEDIVNRRSSYGPGHVHHAGCGCVPDFSKANGKDGDDAGLKVVEATITVADLGNGKPNTELDNTLGKRKNVDMAALFAPALT